MAQAGSWPQIAEHGLLSTSALLSRFGYPSDDPDRLAIESCRRPQSVVITHPDTGETAVIRDNKVLREAALQECLIDLSPREWYETLNARVFFWVSEERLERLLDARAYRGESHDVVTVDTRRLLEAKIEDVTLAPINTGFGMIPSTSAKRGSETFRPIQAYPFEDYLRRRGPADAIVELAVSGQVEGIEAFALRVDRRQCGRPSKTLWVAP